MLYDAEPWHDLFVAAAGAAAALAGLVFVAVSINVERIVRMQGVPERGLQTVLLLLAGVVVSVAGLVPQSVDALGIEVLVLSGALIAFLAFAFPAVLAGTRGHPTWILGQLAASVPTSLAYVGGGFSLIAHSGGGLAWIVVGIVLSFVGAVVNAWVLLVEILR